MSKYHQMSLILLIAVSLGLVACEVGTGSVGQQAIQTPSGTSIIRKTDQVLVSQGQEIYQQNCAFCHGAQAQGDPDWRKPGADGQYPPPPLNGSGHAWHHPAPQLHEMILNGSPPGQGNMPAWDGKLSPGEIDAVIAWFQSLWPDEVYAAWFDREQRFQ